MKLLLSLIAVVSLPFVLQAAQETQSSVRFSGIVLDNDTNQPLAGVQIDLLPTEAGLLRPPPVTTDAQGRFTFETKRSGRVRVVPVKNGYISYLGPNRAPGLPGVWIQLSASTRIDGLELRMGRPGVISGRVVGRPPGTVFPELLRYTYGTDGTYALRFFIGGGQPGGRRPNDLGEFRFYDLPPGEYYIGLQDNPAVAGNGRGYHYYPGLSTDETKAVPIRVTAGEEVRLGTLQLPPPEKDVELKVRVTAPVEGLNANVVVGGMGRTVRSASNSGETVLRILPGHYDLFVIHPSVLSPTHYAVVPLDVGNSDIVRDVQLKPAAVVTGRILMENTAGERVEAPPSISCTLDGLGGPRSGPLSRICGNIGFIPRASELGFRGLPSDAYVLSVKSGDRDLLAEGVKITGDMDLEIVLGQPGAVIAGTVRNSGGEVLPHATVALVPDVSYRATGLRFRSAVTDSHGKFELHGIAPGSYTLFAWPELEGAAYRNAEFMKEFEDRGMPIRVERGTREMVDFPVSDRRQ